MSFICAVRSFPLTTFFALAYGWTWLCWWSVYGIASEQLSLPISQGSLATLGQFGPFAAALVVTWATSGQRGILDLLGSLVRWRVGPQWLCVSLLFLPATMLVAILLFAFLNGSVEALEFRERWSTLPAHFVYLLLVGGPLGEEPGWRGFALPRLQARWGAVWASVWLGALWAGWHLPLWWISGGPCPFPLYVAGAVPMSFLFTWLFNHTQGSVLFAMTFHASMSVASVRLPEVPAYHLWVPLLLLIVLVIVLCDRRLRSGVRNQESGVRG
jgi:uncharacterized protein